MQSFQCRCGIGQLFMSVCAFKGNKRAIVFEQRNAQLKQDRQTCDGACADGIKLCTVSCCIVFCTCIYNLNVVQMENADYLIEEAAAFLKRFNQRELPLRPGDRQRNAGKTGS